MPKKILKLFRKSSRPSRGAAHIHGTLWLDMQEIEKLPIFKTEAGTLTEAFKKLRDDLKLTEEEKIA